MRINDAATRAPTIGTLQEKSLHAALKEWYAQAGDQFEVPVDGFVVDIMRGDLLIEIQTRNFFAMKRKLTQLLEHHRLRLVHPIAQAKWIHRVDRDGKTTISRRKSPQRGRLEHLFDELVSIPQLIMNPNFSLEVLLVHEEEMRCVEIVSKQVHRRSSWRRKGWQLFDHRLIKVIERRVFESPADYLTFLPSELPQCFTNDDLAQALGAPYHVAQKMTYCLRRMNTIELRGKRGASLVYSR